MTAEDILRQTELGAAAALMWASRAGVLSALRKAKKTAPELAAELQCDERALGLVLGVLEASGWTRTEPVGGAKRHVLSVGVDPQLFDREQWMWGQLDNFASTGESLVPESKRDDVYPSVVSYLARRFAPDAHVLAKQLADARHVLDVGAGSGVWSLAVAQRNADTQVTALDGPQTLKVFLQHATDAGLAGRVNTLAGDYHHISLPTAQFDTAMLANVIHLETKKRAAPLVARVASTLAPGGRLVIVDALRDAAEEHARAIAVYALHLGMRVPGSRVYSRSELEELVEHAGLSVSRWVPLSRGLYALIARASA